MSNVDPYTLPPHLDRKETVSVTCRWLREKNATSQPSAAKISSAARPIPRLPPVSITFFPFNPRSLAHSPLSRDRSPIALILVIPPVTCDLAFTPVANGGRGFKLPAQQPFKQG